MSRRRSEGQGPCWLFRSHGVHHFGLVVPTPPCRRRRLFPPVNRYQPYTLYTYRGSQGQWNGHLGVWAHQKKKAPEKGGWANVTPELHRRKHFCLSILLIIRRLLLKKVLAPGGSILILIVSYSLKVIFCQILQHAQSHIKASSCRYSGTSQGMVVASVIER